MYGGGVAWSRRVSGRRTRLVVGSLDGPENPFVRSVVLQYPSVWIGGLTVE